MTLQLRKIDERIIDKWLSAIGIFSKTIKRLLGESLDSIYATEDPEIGVRDYNVIIVVKKPLDDKTIEEIYDLAAKACERAKTDFAIVPKVVVKDTPEADEYVGVLERTGVKVL